MNLCISESGEDGSFHQRLQTLKVSSCIGRWTSPRPSCAQKSSNYDWSDREIKRALWHTPCVRRILRLCNWSHWKWVRWPITNWLVMPIRDRTCNG